mgnify:CR=1 FL=1
MSNVLAVDLEEPIDTITDYSMLLMMIFSQKRDTDFPTFDHGVHRLAMEINSQAQIIEQRVAGKESEA